jgi:FMN-dependent NADH-azoreductase
MEKPMTELLYVSASPKGKNSTSNGMGEAFLSAYSRAHTQDSVRRLDVFTADLPDFGRTEAEAKFAPIFGQARTDEQEAAWSKVVATIKDFDKADKIVISTPMWNFSIPWRLKLYLDILSQPGLTFTVDRDTRQHVGLLKNRPVQLLLTRSSTMPGDYSDFQLPYLKFILGFMGLYDVRVETAWQTTQYTPETRATYAEAAKQRAANAAAAF